MMKKVLAVVVMFVASVAFAKGGGGHGGGGHSSGHSSSHSSSSHTSSAKPAPVYTPAPVRSPTPVRSGGGTHTEDQCKKEKKC